MMTQMTRKQRFVKSMQDERAKLITIWNRQCDAGRFESADWTDEMIRKIDEDIAEVNEDNAYGAVVAKTFADAETL